MNCVKHGKSKDYIDYVNGSNIAGFIKVADAMLDQGLVINFVIVSKSINKFLSNQILETKNQNLYKEESVL